MICRRCGKEVFTEDVSFCPYCGYFLRDSQVYEQNVLPKEQKNSHIIIYFMVIILSAVVLFLTYALSKEYFFIDEQTNNDVLNEKYETKNNVVAEPGVTTIVYNNKYYNQSLKSLNDVYSLIEKDSLKQKNSCATAIVNIEKEIISNYGVKAVNLCEMSVSFAYEIRDLIGFIYNNYPNVRYYLTNITLANVTEESSYIAAFMPIFVFATSPTINNYPMGVKTQIVLNSSYFLNESKFNNTVKYGSNTHFYPKNATKTSTVAHELGHYLSYVALMKHYKVSNLTYVKASDSNILYKVYDDFNEGNFSYLLIQKAYNKYLEQYGYIDFDSFRGSISNYAITKDSNGKYIYDETIAEAFHDYYLNGRNAAIASILIVEALESYL